MNKKSLWSRFTYSIILPAIITIALFIVSIFTLIFPYFEDKLLDKKRETIQELVNSAYTILEDLNNQINDSILTTHQAQYEAVRIIKNLRYGDDGKDYFFITDMQPKMIMHPFRPELDGTDLTDYKDPEGKKLFVEFVKVVEKEGHGFVDYIWQWKDDSTKLVPKLSYVKEFEQWKWIIGTGIYIEDVKEEISRLTKRLIFIALIITFLIGIALFYFVQLNFRLEKNREDINKRLIESKEKYKKLVEASTEGIIMYISNMAVYSNDYVHKITGYNESEFSKLKLNDFLPENDKVFENINRILKGDIQIISFETYLITKNDAEKDVVISASRMELNGEEGIILTVKDISQQKKIEQDLGFSRKKLSSITNNINIGIFRTTMGRRGRFIEINDFAMQLLGISANVDLENIYILELFYEANERRDIISLLSNSGSVKKKTIRVKRLDGIVFTAQISLFMVKDETGKDLFCDGIIQDITEQYKIEQQKEQLIEELQTSNLFMNQPVKTIVKNLVTCRINDSINEAASYMSRSKSDAIIILTDDEKPIGIITDSDIRERVVSGNIPNSTSVFEIISAPLYKISEDKLLFEAIIMMNELNISHLCVTDSSGKINNIISMRQLANAQHQTPDMLVRKIQSSDNKHDLADCFNSIPVLIKAFVESGAKVNTITNLISKFGDEITVRILSTVISKFHDIPVKFSFISLGSMARSEQTLLTDQDNAIIFEDTDEESINSTREYFLRIGTEICDTLNDIGYNHCIGGIMAKNPKYVLTVTEWIKMFKNWITNSSPQDLVDLSIFYDFRHVYGAKELVDDLQENIKEFLVNQSIFFYHMAQTINSIKPPISFFGNFVVESTKENRSTLDIKKVLLPITGFARIYSLKNNILERNTLKRFEKLYENSIISELMYKDLIYAYNYLMMLRIRHQVKNITSGSKPDNFINPKLLSEIERTTLKKIFSQITIFQSKINLDFKGTIF